MSNILAATAALFTALFSSAAFAAQPPVRATPTPTPVFRPSTTTPVYQPKAAPAPTGTPTMKPPVYTWPTAETLTSVSQVTDMKRGDFGYEGLRILIEKYGVAGLTVGKKLMPEQSLTASDYRTITQSAITQLRQLASFAGMTSSKFDGLFGTRCPTPRVMAFDAMPAGDVVDALRCTFSKPTLTALYPGLPMKRGNFVQVFAPAVESIAEKIEAASVKPSPPVSELLESFDDNRHGWPIGNNTGAATSIDGGAYKLEVKFDAILTIVPRAATVPKLDPARDFNIETEFSFVGGKPDDAFGLVWGVSSDRKRRFSFGLLQKGSFFTGNHAGVTWAKEINPRTHNARFDRNGLPNKIALKKSGSLIELYINDTKVGSEPFTTFDPASTFGFELNGQSTVVVNYLKITQK